MTARTPYVTERTQALSSLIYWSPEGAALKVPNDDVVVYANHLEEMEDLIASGSLQGAEGHRARTLEKLYPFDWRLIRSALHQVETTEKRPADSQAHHPPSHDVAEQVTERQNTDTLEISMTLNVRDLDSGRLMFEGHSLEMVSKQELIKATPHLPESLCYKLERKLRSTMFSSLVEFLIEYPSIAGFWEGTK